MKKDKKFRTLTQYEIRKKEEESRNKSFDYIFVTCIIIILIAAGMFLIG